MPEAQPPGAYNTNAHTAIDLSLSAAADAERHRRAIWAAPGSAHDKLIGFLKKGLPILVGILGAFLVVAPFTHEGEVSFVLDKNQVDTASERLKVVEALYRGEDSRGRPFSLRVGSAVQRSSDVPTVEMKDMEARIRLDGGGAMMTAQRGHYDIDEESISIDGPIQFTSEAGYRLTTRDVDIDLNTQQMKSRGRVEGRMPTGTFSADNLEAELETRTVTLNGQARLRITQLGRKGP